MPEAQHAIWVVLGLAIGIGLALYLRQERRRRPRTRPRVPRTSPPQPAIDPIALFTAGTQVGDNSVARVAWVALLHLPTGKIVACDPLTLGDLEPFTRSVEPGEYTVDAAVANVGDHTRIAALRLVLAEGTPVRWELALRAGEELAALADGEAFGYGVDAGVGCFMDATTAALLGERAELTSLGNRGDPLLAELEAAPLVDHHPVSGRAENCAVARSGWGDGIYSSYWGLDERGRLLWLVTDFGVLR